jgi:hypothetical protein
MRCNNIFRIVVLGIILALLVIAIPATPALAAETINVDPDEGEIGDESIEISGSKFDAYERVYIYFSSIEADVGDNIDRLDAYEEVERVLTTADGTFNTEFDVPYELTQGSHPEDVHGGDYYLYVTYRASVRIEAIAQFSVLNGEIELDPEKAQVGTEVEISGEGLRQNQKITIEYDGDIVDIVSGNEETDSEGEFTCTIIVPESTIGSHTITATDESGNKPEAEFIVKPKITLAPTQATSGNTVEVSGTGFTKMEYITITFDGNRVSTNPIEIKTSHKGSFIGSFLVPSYTTSGVSEVRASDHSANKAYAHLTISAGISLSPTTSQTSPGHVGMELTVYGSGFLVNSTVTITYNEATTEATALTGAYGNFSATFTVPPSVAGSHVVTAIDDTNTVTSVFIMEAKAPLPPIPVLPKVAGTAKAEAYFDWEDVNDDSSPVTYTLQVASDADFTTIILEKKGLTHSEYTITTEDNLDLTTNKTPYYWRVKAIDGASNESGWTPPRLFYVGSSWTLYIWVGLGILLLIILGFWLRSRATQR